MQARAAHAPSHLAVETVILPCRCLDAAALALWAAAAAIYPITIAVQAILHMAGGDFDVVSFGETQRLLPGGDFFLE